MTIKLSFVKFLLPALAACSLLGACHKGGEPAFEGDGSPLLARVNKQYLTLAQVRKDMPVGISPEDSARFVKGFVYSWIDEQLLKDMSSKDIDMEEIDRLVEEYRNSLIADAYRRKIIASTDKTPFTEDSLLSYYNEHKADYKLRSPLVKGVYVKLPEDDPNVGVIRRLIQSDKSEDIDRLEKEVLKSNAIHYDYFRERWVDWEQIESRVPYDFGASSDFLKPGKYLNTTVDNHTYLLRITDVLSTGSQMPFDAAKSDIRQRLAVEQRRRLDAAFRSELLQRAIKSGRTEIHLPQ